MLARHFQSPRGPRILSQKCSSGRVNPPPHNSQPLEPPTPLKFFSCNLIRLWKTDPNHKGHWFRMEIFLVLHPGKIKAKIRNLIRCGHGRQSFCEPTPLKCVFPALQTNIPSALTSLDVSYYAKCTFPMLLWITFLSRLPAKSTVEIKKPHHLRLRVT